MEKTKWVDASLEQRLLHLNDIYTPYPEIHRVVEAICRQVQQSQRSRIGSGMLVVMPTGCGKTRMARHLCSVFPDVEEAHRTVRRAVCMRVPTVCTAASFAKSLLLALGDPLPEKGNAHQRTQRGMELLAACGTVLLIIDNAHDIADGRTNSATHAIANWLRDVIDQTSAVVLLLGTKVAMGLITGHAQLARRMPSRFRVNYFDVFSSGGRSRFYRFLQEFDSRLPLPHPCGLGQPALGSPLAHATIGMNAELVDLLARAITRADERSSSALSRADFADAFRERHGDLPPHCNPFEDDFVVKRFIDDFHPLHNFLEDPHAAGPTPA